MNIVDYASLVTAISSWDKRGDLGSQAPDFIGMGEWRLARDLRINPLITSGTTVTYGAGVITASAPTGCIEVVSAKISGQELKYIFPDTYDRAVLNANGMTTPLWYTFRGGNIDLAPAWSAGGNATVSYFKKETALSGSNTTNWYVLNVPDMLLYASLLEASSYLGDMNAMSTWKTFYENARDRVNDTYGVVDGYMRQQNYQAGKAKATSPSV
jgi:hypothetical protein